MNADIRREVRVGVIKALQHLLAFGVRQHRQAMHRLRWFLRQRVGQRRQRDLHHLTDTRRTDTRSDLNIETEARRTLIVHRYVDRVVGALLTEQHVDARQFCLYIRLLAAAVIAVVEQAGE